MAEKAKVKDDWVFKDRLYELTTGRKPLVFTVPTVHSRNKSMLYFDPATNTQRELRYATNQNSVFVDEQKGQCIMGRIVFRNGKLNVKKEEIALQKLLSLYHPCLGKYYEEYKPQELATNEVEWIDIQKQAMNLAKKMYKQTPVIVESRKRIRGCLTKL